MRGLGTTGAAWLSVTEAECERPGAAYEGDADEAKTEPRFIVQ